MKSATYFLCVLLLLFATSSVFAGAEKHLLISFKQNSPLKLYLYSFYGIKTAKIDSTLLTSSGKFDFRLNKDIKKGYYRISVNDTNYTDVIINGLENIELYVAGSNLKTETQIMRSKENKALWELKKYRFKYNDEKRKLIVKQKNKDPESLRVINYSLDSLERYFNSNAFRLLNKNKSSYFYLTNKIIISPLYTDSLILKKEYGNDTSAFLKKNFFNNIDFSSSEIINSTLLPNQYLKYFEKHVEYDEKGFVSAVDLILEKSKANPLVFQLSLDFLLQLFDEVGPAVVFEYIVNTYYNSNTCNSGYIENAEKLKLLSSGNVLPEVILKNSPFKTLRDIYSQKRLTLVYFWSSHCNFCIESIDMIKESYKEYSVSGFEVVAVSIDENEGNWHDYIAKKNLSWINYNELKGWESEIVRKLMVNKTPTFYLLDNNGVILSKRFNFAEIQPLIKNEMNKYQQ
jgi:thiol-disulfide isomerase/thioredoxin